MKNNLWMYSTLEDMSRTASALTTFGAEVFKRAKIIKEFDLLTKISKNLDAQIISPDNDEIMDFIFEYLVDSVRIIIFFENYMKAELIMGGFCIHKLNNSIPGFEKLAKEQRRRPISTKEIHDVLPFEIDEKSKTVFHKAVEETTVSFSNLIGKNFIQFYKFDGIVLNFITELNESRNRLHLYESIQFRLTRDLLEKIRLTNEFVDTVLQMIVPDKSPNED